MFFDQFVNGIAGAMRSFFFLIDGAIYSCIYYAFQVIIYLAHVNLFNLEGINGVISRIYMLLGIFMLFKVSFSFIQYLIDPNSFSETGKGFGKLIQNLLVSLILLVTTPFIFSQLYEFQAKIVTSNIITNLILGTNFGSSGSGANQANERIESVAKDVQFAMYGAFFTLNTGDNGYQDCKPGAENGNGANSNVFGSADMALCLRKGNVGQAIAEQLDAGGGGTLKSLFKYQDDDLANPHCVNGTCDERNFWAFQSLISWQKDGVFMVDYLMIIPAVAGGYLLLLLLSFCVDIAARALKLLFLQMIAPIAIVSYIDPKESASQGKFHNWLQQVITTYLSLFVRLAVLFLAVLLISLITSSLFDGVTGNGTDIYIDPEVGNAARGSAYNMIIYIFLILGIFTFAKQVPNMLKNIFGFEGGDLSLNPFKNEGFRAGLTGVGTVAGGVAGGAIGAGVGITQGYKQGGALGALRGAGGAVTGAVGGAKNTFLNKGKGFLDNGLKQGGRVSWNMHDRHGTTLGSRLESGFALRTGAVLPSQTDKERVEAYQKYNDNYSTVETEGDKWLSDVENEQPYAKNYRASEVALVGAQKAQEEVNKRIAARIANGESSAAVMAAEQDNLKRAAEQVKAAKKARDDAHTIGLNQYVAHHMNDTASSALAEMNRIAHENRHTEGFGKIKQIDRDSIDENGNANAFTVLKDNNKKIKNQREIFSRSNEHEDHAKAEQAAQRRSQRGFWRNNSGK